MNVIVFLLGALFGGLVVWFSKKAMWKLGVATAINELCRQQDIKIQKLNDLLSQKDAEITEWKVLNATLKHELETVKETQGKS
jgi:hypothetical protein